MAASNLRLSFLRSSEESCLDCLDLNLTVPQLPNSVKEAIACYLGPADILRCLMVSSAIYARQGTPDQRRFLQFQFDLQAIIDFYYAMPSPVQLACSGMSLEGSTKEHKAFRLHLEAVKKRVLDVTVRYESCVECIGFAAFGSSVREYYDVLVRITKIGDPPSESLHVAKPQATG